MLKFWPCTIPVPVEAPVHTVPNSKALVSAKVEPGGLGCVVTFTYSYSFMKLDQLVHKTDFVKRGVLGTVAS